MTPERQAEPMDEIKKPSWYNWIPGIECKDVIRHFPFNPGAAIKYIWRAGKKENIVKDYRKAIEHLEDEIFKIESRKNEIHEQINSAKRICRNCKHGNDCVEYFECKNINSPVWADPKRGRQMDLSGKVYGVVVEKNETCECWAPSNTVPKPPPTRLVNEGGLPADKLQARPYDG